MAEIEHPEKYNWWLNELDSLGISTLEKNGISNRREASDLTDAVKQTLYEEYLHQRLQWKITDSESDTCILLVLYDPKPQITTIL